MAVSTETEVTDEQSGGESTRARVGVDVGVELHVAETRFSPFVSLGVGAGSESFRSSATFVGLGGVSEREVHDDGTFIEGRVGVGAEYWLTERFSLSASQQLRAFRARGTRRVRESMPVVETEQDTSEQAVSLAGTSLTLAVYF